MTTREGDVGMKVLKMRHLSGHGPLEAIKGAIFDR
jgi:hypothetical protein